MQVTAFIAIGKTIFALFLGFFAAKVQCDGLSVMHAFNDEADFQANAD
jgi:hypothetical protein